MYRTLPDGTVEKEYISYDDPILAKVSKRTFNIWTFSWSLKNASTSKILVQVPIQKRDEGGKVTIAKDKTASNFQVFQSILSSSMPVFSATSKRNVPVGCAEAKPEQRAE